MTDLQENRLSHYEKVNAFLLKHKDEFTAVPAIMATLQPQLAASIDKMHSDDEHAVQDNTGYADNKEDLEVKLENLVDHVGSGLESYADDRDDFVLMNAVEFTLSQIQAFRDNRLIQYSQFVYGKATDASIQPELLTGHNITTDDITTLGTLITGYESANPLPQQMKGEAVAWGKQVDRDLADADKILVRIRRKMNTLRATNPLLFDAFTAVDNVDDTGSHKSKEKTIGGGQTQTVQSSINYKADAPVKLENTGEPLLSFSLYSNGTAVGNVIQVAGGNTQTVTLADFAPSGDELKVTNEDHSLTGSYIVTL